MITTVSLDAGGVLVNPNWERVAEALRRHGVAADARRLADAEPAAKRGFDSAVTIQSTTDTQRGWLYFNQVLERSGITPSSATDAALYELQRYHSENNLWESVPPGVPETLSALRSRGLKLVVVSNANGRLHALLDRLGLAQNFDAVVDSCLEGVEKPDPRLFAIALARVGARPDRTVHVGDLYHIDVVGARAAGIHPVLLDTAGLYSDADCPRVRSVPELGAFLDAKRSDT